MAISDNNVSASGEQTPGLHAEAITPADATDLTAVTRGVYVGVTGDVTVVMMGTEGDSSVTFTAVPAGSVLPIRVREISATGTTATDIVALW